MIDLAFSLPLTPPEPDAPPLSSRKALEVLRLGVDDTELLQGHGEENREVLLEELLCLGEALAGGAWQATALFGPEPVELSVIALDDEVQITVLIHGMPPRLVLHRYPAPRMHLLREIASLATSVAKMAPTTRSARRLGARAAHLRRPPRNPRPDPLHALVAPPLPGPGNFEASIGDGWLLRLVRDPGPEAIHLVPSETGRLQIEAPGEAFTHATKIVFDYQGPLLPFLEALLPVVSEALASLDTRSFGPLPFGETTLIGSGEQLRLESGDVAIPCSALKFLDVTLSTFGDYIQAVATAHGTLTRPLPARLLEADEARQALLARLRLDTHPPRAILVPEETPPLSDRSSAGPRFGAGSLRHVGLRRLFCLELETATRTLIAHHRTLVVAGEARLTLVDASTGEVRAQLPGFDRALPVPGSADFLITGAQGLARISPTGLRRWGHGCASLIETAPVLTRNTVTFLTDRSALQSLCLEDGSRRFRSLSATDPSLQRWVIRTGPDTLLVDAAGVAERFDALGQVSRFGLDLSPSVSPLLLGQGALLFVGERDGGLVAQIHQRALGAETRRSLPLPLARVSGLARLGRRVLLWGPRPVGTQETWILFSLPARGGKARVEHPGLPGPLSIAAIAHGLLVADGRGTCTRLEATPPARPRPQIALELGAGPMSVLPFGELALLCAERLFVLQPSTLRLLGEVELDPAEGPVTAVRGPGASISLMDTHGCLQRFLVGVHLSLI